LSQIAKTFPEELVFLSYKPDDIAGLAFTGKLNYRELPIQPIYPPPQLPEQGTPEFYVRQRPLVSPPPRDLNAVKFDASSESAFRKAGIDILLLLSPFFHAFSCRLPFVMPIFDLNHKLQPEFPEVSAFGEINNRDYMYMNACRFATLILVDSEVGKADVLRFYGDFIAEDRIRILPYYPPIVRRQMPSTGDLARVRDKYGLPVRYFFYPAQFWPHKNHELILRALRLIADETTDVVHVVVCGSYADFNRALNFQKLEALAKDLNITDRFHYLGIVPDEDMAELYLMSDGLVMPTFFGPTNVPPLEAWHFGRPVITSDIRGLREQIGDAGLLVDPRSPQDLAGAMLRLWRDQALAVELAERGRRYLSSYSWDAFVATITGILLEACDRVRTGRAPIYP
jgi:glycosyltransferase involved in cell wall biosynthesis